MHVLIREYQILFLVFGNYITSKAVCEQIHVFPSSTMHSWNSQKFKVTVWKANHSYSASQCSGRLDVAFSSQQNSIKQVSNHREAVSSEGAYMAITPLKFKNLCMILESNCPVVLKQRLFPYCPFHFFSIWFHCEGIKPNLQNHSHFHGNSLWCFEVHCCSKQKKWPSCWDKEALRVFFLTIKIHF